MAVSGREILILYNYFLFAHDLRARHVRDSPLVCYPLSGGQVPEQVIISGLNMRGWYLALATVVEGWLELKRRDDSFADALVDSVLSRPTGRLRKRRLRWAWWRWFREKNRNETFADVLVDARHDFAHFKPQYLPRRWRRLEVDAGHYPSELHQAFENFFLMWFHKQRRLREEGRT